ncbi:aminoglycoside phosphotransferase family protein [Sphingomonas sp. LY54]|uniref:aminoglycoside phosphotransferase family protein n=1 Tax=Sphingomonas sp. LY54 TaxID=3095343 RepID=UPI002D79F251|nr:aminoglycoside phosphotransferase family protein [Sphingomonas sp. LY54]WRP27723.1 aminoglycoside phosphotransferase family protein [Sphingomonas sp. LY54]
MDEINLTEQITSAYRRDLAAGRTVIHCREVPPFYDAITPQWLTEILCRNVQGAAVTRFSFDNVYNGTTNRRRLLLEYNTAAESDGLPPSVFCKATFDLPNRILLSSSAAFSEVTFFNRLRGELPIDCPSALFAAYDPESWASIIVMRDLTGDVEFCSEETVVGHREVRSQLRLLATMHARFYESPRFHADLADIIPFHRRFHDLNKLHGIGACSRRGLHAAEEVVPPALFAMGDRVWEATERAVAWQEGQPETFTHGDVHLKNWYRRRDGAMGIGDWQASGRGHWARDLAYLLGTALRPDTRRSNERAYLTVYLDLLAEAGGPRLEFDDAFVMYRAQMLTALAWWTMTLIPSDAMPKMQPVCTTRLFVHRLSTACDDLDSVGAVNSLCGV